MSGREQAMFETLLQLTSLESLKSAPKSEKRFRKESIEFLMKELYFCLLGDGDDDLIEKMLGILLEADKKLDFSQLFEDAEVTVVILYNLAVCFEKKGDLKASAEYLKLAFEKLEKIIGTEGKSGYAESNRSEEHPKLAESDRIQSSSRNVESLKTQSSSKQAVSSRSIGSSKASDPNRLLKYADATYTQKVFGISESTRSNNSSKVRGQKKPSNPSNTVDSRSSPNFLLFRRRNFLSQINLQLASLYSQLSLHDLSLQFSRDSLCRVISTISDFAKLTSHSPTTQLSTFAQRMATESPDPRGAELRALRWLGEGTRRFLKAREGEKIVGSAKEKVTLEDIMRLKPLKMGQLGISEEKRIDEEGSKPQGTKEGRSNHQGSDEEVSRAQRLESVPNPSQGSPPLDKIHASSPQVNSSPLARLESESEICAGYVCLLSGACYSISTELRCLASLWNTTSSPGRLAGLVALNHIRKSPLFEESEYFYLKSIEVLNFFFSESVILERLVNSFGGYYSAAGRPITEEEELSLTASRIPPAETSTSHCNHQGPHARPFKGYFEDQPTRSRLGYLKDSSKRNAKETSKGRLLGLSNSPLKVIFKSPLKDLSKNPLQGISKGTLYTSYRVPQSSFHKAPLQNPSASPFENPQNVCHQDASKVILRDKVRPQSNSQPQSPRRNLSRPKAHSRSIRLQNHSQPNSPLKSPGVSLAHDPYKPQKHSTKEETVIDPYDHAVTLKPQICSNPKPRGLPKIQNYSQRLQSPSTLTHRALIHSIPKSPPTGPLRSQTLSVPKSPACLLSQREEEKPVPSAQAVSETRLPFRSISVNSGAGRLEQRRASPDSDAVFQPLDPNPSKEYWVVKRRPTPARLA